MAVVLKKCAAERLSPHQYLLLELLAAHRLMGESEVILPTMTVGVAKGLASQSLVSWRAVDEGGIGISLTPTGVRAVSDI